MAGIYDWALTRSCTIYPYDGRDVYGNPQWGIPTYLECAIRWKAKQETRQNNIGSEFTSMYEIRFKDEYKDLFKRLNYIVLDEDTTTEPDPVVAGGHGIEEVRGVAADMVGSDDSYKCWV